MRKLEVSLITCVAIIGILVVSTIWFYEVNVWLENNRQLLIDENKSLRMQTNTLQSEVDSLDENNTLLQNENENLQNENDELQDANDLLSTQNDELQNQVDTLEIENTQLQTKVSSLQSQVDYLQETAEENMFMFYYDPLAPEQQYGVLGLEEYLDTWEWTEGTYIEDVFDCSEMSAYIERELENQGYHTYMVLGPAPWGGEGDHAWLLVETSVGHYMPVEATEYDLVKWDDPYFDNYFVYDLEFETIFDALEYNYEEFDWWAS